MHSACSAPLQRRRSQTPEAATPACVITPELDGPDDRPLGLCSGWSVGTPFARKITMLGPADVLYDLGYLLH
jgi:hypothetical protein